MPGVVPRVGHNSDYLCLSRSTVVWTLACLDFLRHLRDCRASETWDPFPAASSVLGAWGILPLPGTQVLPLSMGYLDQNSGGHTPE